MTLTRAIELTQENIETIANSGVITLADAQALLEHTTSHTERRMFVVDYKAKWGDIYEWIVITPDAFRRDFRWTEPERTGFRYCREN